MTDDGSLRHQLAQLNIARLTAPIDSPQLTDFVANLERINALAEASPGFVWRLKDDGGDATAIRHFGDDVIINMSVWQDVASLQDYVYRSAHTEVLRRREEWFQKIREGHLVLWWVPAGHRPSLDEAGNSLEGLRKDGPTPDAFTFKKVYPPPAA
jgi:hypothetical protein